MWSMGAVGLREVILNSFEQATSCHLFISGVPALTYITHHHGSRPGSWLLGKVADESNNLLTWSIESNDSSRRPWQEASSTPRGRAVPSLLLPGLG